MGARGQTGSTGSTGRKGQRGTAGLAGPPGSLKRADARELVTVAHQIEDIYEELNVQMKRMAQLQVQVDEVRTQLRKLTGI